MASNDLASKTLPVTPTELEQMLMWLVPTGITINVTGRPGSGKTAIIEQTLDKMNWDTLLTHPGNWMVEDVRGLPVHKDGKAEFLTFGEIEQARTWRNPDKPGLGMLLDDAHQTMPSVLNCLKNFMFERRLNNIVLPPEVTMILTMNRREDKAGAQTLFTPVKDRYCVLELLNTHRDWIVWAANAGIDPMVIAYIALEGDEALYFGEPTNDLAQNASPRSWELVSRARAAEPRDLPEKLQLAGYTGFVGFPQATAFTGFCRLYNQIPNYDRILVDPDSVAVPDNRNRHQSMTIYALVGALVGLATPENFDNIMQYMARCPKTFQYLFVTLTTKGPRANVDLTRTTSYAKWAAKAVNA